MRIFPSVIWKIKENACLISLLNYLSSRLPRESPFPQVKWLKIPGCIQKTNWSFDDTENIYISWASDDLLNSCYSYRHQSRKPSFPVRSTVGCRSCGFLGISILLSVFILKPKTSGYFSYECTINPVLNNRLWRLDCFHSSLEPAAARSCDSRTKHEERRNHASCKTERQLVRICLSSCPFQEQNRNTSFPQVPCREIPQAFWILCKILLWQAVVAWPILWLLGYIELQGIARIQGVA